MNASCMISIYVDIMNESNSKSLLAKLQVQSTVMRGPLIDEVHQQISSWIYQVLCVVVFLYSLYLNQCDASQFLFVAMCIAGKKEN